MKRKRLRRGDTVMIRDDPDVGFGVVVGRSYKLEGCVEVVFPNRWTAFINRRHLAFVKREKR